VDQHPASSPVAIDERVDSLELRVCERRLRDGGKIVLIAELAQVSDEIGYAARRRGNELCAAGVV
jgi:hypothetical protein